MLINLVEILKLAEEKKIAVGAFNTPNTESLFAVLDAAERVDVPVIIMHAQVHEPASHLTQIGPLMIDAAKRAKVPVCVQLDHCEDFEYMQIALDIGFTGIMYDGSCLTYEENLANTVRAVSMCKPYGAGVEGELGRMPSREGGEDIAAGPVYTNPEQAVAFCKATGIDALVPSFGTAHGVYKSVPVLDLELVKVIREKTGLPLVMHGGSGISEKDYRIGIRNGLRKINYYSYMASAGVNAAKDLLGSQNVTFYHDVAFAVQQAMSANVEKTIRVFSGF